MLKITIPGGEQYDEVNNEFITLKEATLQLEHSLVSLSKWESKWKKPFLSKEEKTTEQMVDYIRCMTITQSVRPEIYSFVTNDNVAKIQAYIDDSMTATIIGSVAKPPQRRTITAELIYCWMIALQIPFECQKWHLNRLLTLINVCSIENGPKQKMPKSEVLRRQAAVNAARRRKFGTRG